MSDLRRSIVVLAVLGLLCLRNNLSTSDPVSASESQGPATAGANPQPATAPAFLPRGPTEKDFPHLHHLLQVTGRIYSGGEPGDEEAFASLAKLGVKTIVSVDGAVPNVAAAEKHGLRYVHIPFGYDGINKDAGLSLARVAREVDGPIYVHCHHGQHRGPAAAAIVCIASGAADGPTALRVLEQAGTGMNYAGLWRDVERYQPPAPGVLLPELVSIAKVDSLAAAMAKLDRASDNLKLSQAEEWKTPANHPDIVARQEALLLKEGFREAVRLLETDAAMRDERFKTWLREAETVSETIEQAFDAHDLKAANERFTVLQDQCKRCHTAYRN